MKVDVNVKLIFLTTEYAIILNVGPKSVIMTDQTANSLIVTILCVKYLICLTMSVNTNIATKKDVTTMITINVFLIANVILMLLEMEYVISNVTHLTVKVTEEIVLLTTVNAHLI